jgi:hypothetical protein
MQAFHLKSFRAQPNKNTQPTTDNQNPRANRKARFLHQRLARANHKARHYQLPIANVQRPVTWATFHGKRLQCRG